MAVEISQTAFVKLVMHTLKYPNSSVNGILLGRCSEEKLKSVAEESDPKEGRISVFLEDSIPLFHSQLELAPMMELALSMVDKYCETKKDKLQILGYYQANENFQDPELSGIAVKISDQIRKFSPNARALVVDSIMLEKAVRDRATESPALFLFENNEYKWRCNPSGIKFSSATTSGILVDFVEEERYKKLADFEDHLDNISLDFLNAGFMN